MTAAILVAAGSGTRMGANVDKLFLEVAGKPVVAHTWARFEQSSVIDEIILVIRPGREALFAQVAATQQFKKRYVFVPGGSERQDSVWNGLEALSPRAELVAIHDAARPCVAPALIEATVEAARRHGAAVAARRMVDTVKRSEDGLFVSEHLDRAKLWTVQTPQCFRVPIIKRALALVRERTMVVTDDTASCALIGQPVLLMESATPNPKVTTADDLPYIEELLRQKSAG